VVLPGYAWFPDTDRSVATNVTARPFSVCGSSGGTHVRFAHHHHQVMSGPRNSRSDGSDGAIEHFDLLVVLHPEDLGEYDWDESRNGLARKVIHADTGGLGQRYKAGRENQLGALGLLVNIIVLWQTVDTRAALDHLAATNYDIGPADVARLSPLAHPTINVTVDMKPPMKRPPIRSDPSESTPERPFTQDFAQILVRPGRRVGLAACAAVAGKDRWRWRWRIRVCRRDLG